MNLVSNIIRAEIAKIEMPVNCKNVDFNIYEDVLYQIDDGQSYESILTNLRTRHNLGINSNNLLEALYDIVLYDKNYWILRECLSTCKNDY